MENLPSKNKLSQWLDELQQESWQLELLISGFVIFLLLGVYEPLTNMETSLVKLIASAEGQNHYIIPYFVLLAVWFCCLINLLIHVLLRGLWISTVGLRYVSGEIDYSQLRLSKRFERFIMRKAGSFDRYIDRLERLCSVIFAFTFLIVFMLLSIGLFGFYMQLLFDKLLKDLPDSGSVFWEGFYNALSLTFVVFAIIYFLDFITLGRIKRVKWFSVVYYPIYRLMGWLTLANFYRPLYYNLIDNKFGRWVGILLVPYLVLAAVLSSVSFKGYQYFPFTSDSHPTFFDKKHYEEEHIEEFLTLPVTIPSKFVDNGFLEVFIPYIPVQDDGAVAYLCDSITPHHEIGINLEGVINSGMNELDYDPKELLGCLSKIYSVYIDDSLYQNLHYFFIEKGDQFQPGLTTIIDVSHYERGEHLLYLDALRYRESEDTVQANTRARIPFWIE